MSSTDLILAAAGTGGAEPLFVDAVFSNYLYTGNGSTQTINNGIDLAGEGGMVWCKGRNDAFWHSLIDTVRGNTKTLHSNTTSAEGTYTDAITSFNNNGFTLGADTQVGYVNASTYNFVSWAFRKAPKFFDVVTYTGTGAARTISHNLGSVPGMIIVKKTNNTGDWWTYHRSLANTQYLRLNLTNAAGTSADIWNSTTPTSSVFSLGATSANASGDTYVAYLFAHDAGGFGESGTDNVISCGSFTTDGTGKATVSLGYEPQYVLWKQTDGVDNWYVNDIMRGMNVSGSDKNLSPNSSAAESAGGYDTTPNATGFIANPGIASKNYIYMAIRRPMKPPTSGTEVFSPITSSASTGTQLTTNFVVDSQWINYRAGASENTAFNDRLRGNSSTTTSIGNILISSSTAAESSVATTRNWGNTGFEVPSYYSGGSTIYWNFSRRPGFFDEVCYTGTGTIRNLTHNLAKAPGMVIVRGRSSDTAGEDWAVWHQNGSQANGYLGARLNTTQAYGDYGQSLWQDDTTPPNMTSTTISLGTNDIVNASAKTYVAYLFGEVAGVSKVGSYTGTGATQTINCGFTGGARFVLIKRIDSNGSWFVWDTARGMVSGTDPRLTLNLTGAESNADWVLTATTGFQIVTTAASVNESGASYIYLAIA